MRVIGLCGYGAVGKDEVGDILVREHGYVRFAKGDLIKEAAARINPLIEYANGGHHVQHLMTVGARLRPQGTVVEQIDAAKDVYPAVRTYLQTLADEVVGVLGDDVWNAALWRSIVAYRDAGSRIEGGWPRIVLTRLSLPQEADELRARGGKLLRVVRPGYGPANDHPNEVALDDYPSDWVIVNNGTLDDLAREVADVEADLWA